MSTEELAINGGKPVRTAPWHETSAIGAEEKEAAMRVMDSGRLSLFLGTYDSLPPYNFHGGPEVQGLESLAKEIIGVSHVAAVNSATSGLNAAIGALEIGFGDEVIVSPYTMSACAVAPLWYGAIPVFADVAMETGCLDPASICEKVTERTKAILVIHQFGIPADMDSIMAIAKEHDLRVIEDCAQAWGAKYKGKNVGTIGDIGVFSFNVHKTIQSGEGGLCVTNDEELGLRLQMIRNHGEAVVEGAEYEKIENIVGCNYRMTEVHAAIAAEQMKKLPSLNANRLAMVHTLNDGLRQFDFLTVPEPEETREATYYMYPLRYHEERLGIPREEFVEMIQAEGIHLLQGYMRPLYLLPLFKKRTAFKNGYPWTAPENSESDPKYELGICPNTEKLHFKEMLIMLYLYPPHTEEDMLDVIRAVEKISSARK